VNTLLASHNETAHARRCCHWTFKN